MNRRALLVTIVVALLTLGFGFYGFWTEVGTVEQPTPPQELPPSYFPLHSTEGALGKPIPPPDLTASPSPPIYAPTPVE